MYRQQIAHALLLAALVLWTAPAGAAPAVVATIVPVHSLVSAVGAGVIEPHLLLRGGTSPHAYSLAPSDARALADARLVFWVGRPLESFLARMLVADEREGRIVTLVDAPGIRLLPVREGGTWAVTGDHDHDPGVETAREALPWSAVDGHLWLSPDNARAIIDAAATALARVDPDHAERYRANAAATVRRIDALEAQIADRLAPVRDRGFIVFHDAFQYFERHFGLNGVGSIALSPEHQPGARRIAELRRTLAARDVRCVFAEPQFEPSLVATVIEDSDTRSATLDPLGAGLEPGPDAWFELMRHLAESLAQCLGDDEPRAAAPMDEMPQASDNTRWSPAGTAGPPVCRVSSFLPEGMRPASRSFSWSHASAPASTSRRHRTRSSTSPPAARRRPSPACRTPST